MTQEEHAELIREEADGRLLFGIDRAFARRFFTDLPLRTIERDTGEATYLEKLVVFGAFIGAPICLLIAAVFGVLYFRSWSILIVTVTFAAWLLFSGRSSMGRSRILGISLATLAAVALHIFGSFDSRFTLFLLFVAAAFWLNRFMYLAATMFLRALIIRSRRAFSFLHDHITIKRA